ncbi:MAG TPA: PQQ-binding-like beta-propeller repeat protein [Pirellulales bacterium]|nr:PQQ-binding-like beta-propeller repeat protein [Pirellulales bacterium]
MRHRRIAARTFCWLFTFLYPAVVAGLACPSLWAAPPDAPALSNTAAASNASSPNSGLSNQNWPQWRGPLGTGVAPDAHPPTAWSANLDGTQKNIKWKVSLPGAGTSTPIVWSDQIFIQTAVPTGRKIELPADPPPDANDAAPKEATSKDASSSTPPADAKDAGKDVAKDAPKPKPPPMFNIQKPDEYYQFVLLSLDRQTGQERWRAVAAEVVPHEGHHPDHGFASYSPVTDGACVISYFGSRGLHCYDMQGHLKWEKDLGKMTTIFSFGEGSSPALYGNTVVVNWDHEAGSFIVAFNKDTGQELWRTPRDEKTSWATPLIVPTGDQTLVVTSGKQKARAYDLATGKQVWECGGLTPAAIPSPVAADGIAYIMTGFQGSSLLAIRLGQTGDLTSTDAVAWKFDKDTPYVPSPLLYDGRLYCFKVNKAIVSCFNAATGERLFGPQRLDGLQDAYASPVGADGKVYFVGRNGTTAVIRNADTLEVLATNPLDEGVDASPALAGNEIFLRGKQHLFCISQP